jgi:hypothetical protein
MPTVAPLTHEARPVWVHLTKRMPTAKKCDKLALAQAHYIDDVFQDHLSTDHPSNARTSDCQLDNCRKTIGWPLCRNQNQHLATSHK